MGRVDALDQGVGEALLGQGSSRQFRSRPTLAGSTALFLYVLGELDQPLGGIRAAIEEHVLDVLAQLFGDLVVDRELAGVDDAHVQAGVDGVVEERRVHGFADRVVAAERERDVAHAAGDLGTGAARP